MKTLKQLATERPLTPEGLPYLTTVEAAEKAHRSTTVIASWVRKGYLPNTRQTPLGYLIDPKDLKGFKPPKPGPKSKRTTKPGDPEQGRLF